MLEISKTNNLLNYRFNNFDVRIIIDGEELMFVAKDAAEALGYINSHKAINDHCKGVTKRYPLWTTGGTQELRVIGEPDLLRLIIHSKLEEAQKFERWIFEEVLPDIRKKGSYSMTDNIPKTFSQALMLAAKQQLIIEKQQAKIKEDEERVAFGHYVERISDENRTQSLGEMFLSYGYDEWKLQQKENEIQCKIARQSRNIKCE